MTAIHIANIHLLDPCPVTSFEGRPYEIRLRCLDESYLHINQDAYTWMNTPVKYSIAVLCSCRRRIRRYLSQSPPWPLIFRYWSHPHWPHYLSWEDPSPWDRLLCQPLTSRRRFFRLQVRYDTVLIDRSPTLFGIWWTTLRTRWRGSWPNLIVRWRILPPAAVTTTTE